LKRQLCPCPSCLAMVISCMLLVPS
jgi:hypothetical protein